MLKQYEFLEHPADIKIRSFGKDLAEMFVNMALGMMAFLFDPIITPSQPSEKITITVDGNDLESLLINWLAEILWLSQTNYSICLNYKITEFSQNKITATIDLRPAKAKNDIKAVTYHGLKIYQQNNYWIAEVVYDI